MKNLKLTFLVFTFAIFAGSQALVAQDKIETKKGESTSQVEVEQMVQDMEAKLREASPEDKIKIQAKIDAYRKHAMPDQAKLSSKNMTLEEKRAIHDREKAQANTLTMTTADLRAEKQLETGKKKIHMAQMRLDEDKKNGKLTPEQIEASEMKIKVASKELYEVRKAFQKKQALIKQERLNTSKKAQKNN